MENFTQIYHRLIYRDFLGYVLPGALIIMSLIFSFSDKSFFDTFFKFGELSWAWLMILGVSFAVGHILAVIPRHLPNRERKREEGIIRAMEHPRIKRVQEFTEDVQTEDDKIKKYEYINRWVNANEKRTELANRLEALRIFFEHMRFAIPCSLLTYGCIKAYPAKDFWLLIPFLICSILLFVVCTVGYKGILLRELREIVNIYIDSKIQSSK